MTIGRRTFIRDTLLLGSAPTLANVTLLSPFAPLDRVVRQPIAGGAEKSRVVFKIDGWDRYGEIAFDRSTNRSLESAHNTLSNHEVWIAINRSWRAAWR
jgi:hypothetical protein